MDRGTRCLAFAQSNKDDAKVTFTIYILSDKGEPFKCLYIFIEFILLNNKKNLYLFLKHKLKLSNEEYIF